MRRPLQPGEALALSVALHAAFLLLFSVHLAHSPPPEPPRKPPEPVRFQFVDLPPDPAEVPPREDAPTSDVDRTARGGEPPSEVPENPQPRTQGNTPEMVVRNTPRPQPQPRPQPPEPRPELPERPRRPGPRPERQPPEEDTRPTPEQKREYVIQALKDLTTTDLLERNDQFDNPKGDFFDNPGVENSIMFETKGVDWGPYAARLHRIVRRNWIIPPAAQIGTKGVVRVRFEIGRDGTVHNLEILDDSGTVALDDAAWAAIHNSHPLPPPPLPDDWHKETVGVRWTFYYNVRPR